MLKGLISFVSISIVMAFIACGGGKEKARQESIKKAEEAKQKAEQDKKQAWQDLLNACKDEEKGALIGSSYKLRKEDINKNDLRHLIKQGKLKEDANKFSTDGKRKLETGYLLCVYEYYDEKEEIMGDIPTKTYNVSGWIFATDEQGTITDALKIYQSTRASELKEKEPDTYSGTVLSNTKQFTVEILIGNQYGIDFTGEKIRYVLENGKFKETSRKKEKMILAD